MADGQKKIIVVDDNDSNLLTCKNILRPYYSVFTVPSAARMFDLIGKISPNLILLDVEMPEMDGYEAAQKLKTEHKEIPFIFLTGNADAESQKKGMELGALDYIHKPFVAEVLLKRLESHLG